MTKSHEYPNESSHQAMAFAMAFMVALAISPSVSAAAEWQDALENEIVSIYSVTQRSALGRIKQPGTILVVQKEGLKADAPKVMIRPTRVRNGEILAVGGGALVGGMEGKALDTGDRVYLFDVRVKKNAIDFLIGTVETFDIVAEGKTRSILFEAAVRFEFDPGYLENADISAVMEQVNKIFLSQDQAAVASTKTIELGQTEEEVKAALGQPQKVIKLGSKTIYVYDDLKVIFIEGKVADVE